MRDEVLELEVAVLGRDPWKQALAQLVDQQGAKLLAPVAPQTGLHASDEI